MRSTVCDRPLVGRVERAQRIDLVAEELDADRQRHRGREDIHDPATAGELAAAGDLGDRRVPEIEQVVQQGVLVEPGARGDLARRCGQVVRRDRVLEERLDAGDHDPGAAAPPRGEGGDPGRGLVRDELAPLVGQGRARLQDDDRRRVAQPRPELLGDPVADLGIAGDPHEPFARGGQGERGGEVGLGTVGNGRQAGVPAALGLGRLVARRARAAPAGSRTSRSGRSSGGNPDRSGSRWPVPFFAMAAPAAAAVAARRASIARARSFAASRSASSRPSARR